MLSYTENSWSLSIKTKQTMLGLPFIVVISTMGLICSSTLISLY